MEECRIRAEAFFKEKEERKKAEELIKTQLAAVEAAASKAWCAHQRLPAPSPRKAPPLHHSRAGQELGFPDPSTQNPQST